MNIPFVAMVGVSLIAIGWAIWGLLHPKRPAWAEQQDNLQEGTRYWDSVLHHTSKAGRHPWD
jgi:hypothetical protein